MKRFRDGQWVLSFALIFPLAIIVLLLSGPTLDAQEIIDPRSGQLFLSVTDLAVQAGPVSLEIRRSLESGQRQPGLLGSKWRLNWESRLIQAGPLVLIEDAGITVQFDSDGSSAGYKTASGDRLAFDKSGRVTRTKPDRTKEIFDAQGRLVERDYRNGNRVVIHYSPEGRLAKIEGPRGSYLKFTADKAGRVIQVEASTTATVRYAYSNDQLTEVQLPPRPPTRYSYYNDGRLARIEDSQSGGVQFAYDFKGRVMSRRWADGSKERYEYDDKANRLRYTDAVGAVTTSQWSKDGRRQEVTDPLGRKSVLESDVTGRPVSATGPTGATSRIAYDALGRTVAVTDPLGRVTKLEYLGASSLIQAISQPGADRQVFEYDAHGNLTAIRVGSATVSALTYHPDGGLATARGLDAPERRFSYHPDGRLKSIANALGETTQFEYDRRGNLIREVNPLGGVTVRSYDAQDRLVSLTDPIGGTTRYEYDAKGRLTKITDPSGGAARFEYDARGRLVAETGPTGLVTKYEYDAAGREVKVVEPGNRITTRRYDALGNLTGLTDSLGRTTQFDYDQLGRVARERRPTGLEITYRYDSLGNLLGSEDNAGAKSELQRDASGLVTSTVDPLGAVTRYQYDPLGNMVSLTDPAGHLTRYTYAQVGALAGVRLPSGDEGRYEYDAAGRVVGLRRPSGGTTRIAYNAMGNITTTSDPLGNKRQQSYDLSGRSISATDGAGRVTGYIYDRSGRLAEKRLFDGRKVTYEYDALGNRLKADDGAFPVLFRYDKEARLIGVEYPAIKKSIRYAYDPSGLKTKLIDAEGREVHYEHNGMKQLSAIVLPDGKRIALAYDLKDRLSSVQYPNGVSGQWEYDAAGRILRISYRDRDGKAVAGFTYRYDPAGNPVERQDSQGRTARLQYDSAGQLVEEVGPGGTARYRYLPGGNRATVEERGAVTQHRYDADDRLVQAGAEQITYDKNGNLIGRKGSSGSIAYEYDAEERLVKVVGHDGGTTTFGYAPTSERVWKRDQQGLTYYLYDGFDLIQELEEGGSVKATYVHGPGIDRPLAMIRDGKTYYYHADRLGSISHLTDEQGQIVATYGYDLFGKMREQHGSVRNPFAFTGREFDSSTGLYYYRARYYDATLGRFLSADPAAPRLDEPLDLNPYLYVRNNPARFVDPLGLAVLGPLWAAEPIAAQIAQLEYLAGRYEAALEAANAWPKPDPKYQQNIRQNIADMEAEAARLRAAARSAASEGAGSAGGRPRTPTMRIQQPEAPAAPEAPGPGGRGGPTRAVPRPGGPRPEALAPPGGRTLGVKPETLNRVVVGAAAALQLASCLELGKGIEHCSLEAGIGLAAGLLIAKAAAAAGLSIPVLLAAGGYSWVQVGREGSQAVRDLLARRQAQQAREAQQQVNWTNRGAIIAQLEAQIDGQLAALRGQMAGAVAGAKGAAQSAANAANAASNLLTQLKGYGAQIAAAVAACKEVESLMSQIASAKQFAELADTAFTIAQSDVDACQSKDQLNTAQNAYDHAKMLASSANLYYRRAPEAINKLNAIRAQSAQARSALSQAAGIVGNIAAEASSASGFAETASSEADKADQLFADLKTRKAALLDQVGRVRGGFHREPLEVDGRVVDGLEVDQLFAPLIGRLTAEETAPTARASVNWADREQVRASGILSQAEALLGAFQGFPLCDEVNIPSIDEATQAVANLGLGGMGEGFSGKAAACLAKLTPGQTPVTTTGGDTPPGDPTLTKFSVSCSPSNVKVGQSSSCKAVGEYSTQPGVYVDLTHLAAWGPGPTVIPDWPGSWFAKASHGGKSATDTVTVIDDEKGPGPDIKGASQQPFSGGIPSDAPTSGVTGGGKEPKEQPDLRPPATGPTESGTPGQPPPAGVAPSGDPSVRTPWQGQVKPPMAKPPMGSKPPGPGTGSPPVASGQNCDPPLCTRRGQTDCQAPNLGPDPKSGDWEKKCYQNMLMRCNQGMSGRTGGWCVMKGADASCEARAERVCGCDPVRNPRCGGKWE